MTYTPTTWVDGVTPVNATNLNKMETAIDTLDDRVTTEEGMPDIPAVVNGSWLKGSGGAMVWSAIAQADVTGLVTALAAKEATANKGAANGYAPLDSSSKVPTANLPAASGGGVDYIGTWGAGTAYVRGDVVSYNGVDYLAVNPSTGQTPPPATPLPTAIACLYDNLLSADAANFDVSSIAPDYADLQFVLQARGTAGAVTSILLRLNNDSSALYDSQSFYGDASTYGAASLFAQTSIAIGLLPAADAPSGAAGSLQAIIPNYASTTFFKNVVAVGYGRYGTTLNRMWNHGGEWRSTATVNRITILPLSGNFLAGSRLSIYGVLGL